MRPRAPSGFSNYKRIKKMLVGAVGIEPPLQLAKVLIHLGICVSIGSKTVQNGLIGVITIAVVRVDLSRV